VGWARLLPFRERFLNRTIPRVPACGLHPRLYKLVAFGDDAVIYVAGIVSCARSLLFLYP